MAAGHQVLKRGAIKGGELLFVDCVIAYERVLRAIVKRHFEGEGFGEFIAIQRGEEVGGFAVSMVEMAIARLEDEDVVQLDEERKAAMVSNLLVVLCGDQRATPVVNTGSLYT